MNTVSNDISDSSLLTSFDRYKMEFSLFYGVLGLPKEPKRGHLRDLHAALKLCRKGLLWGSYSLQKFGANLEVKLQRAGFIDHLRYVQ